MNGTTVPRPTPSSVVRARQGASESALLARYRELAEADSLIWQAQYRKVRVLGRGGQGVVYLAWRQGVDGFRLPVALKAFSPEPYADEPAYREAMQAMAAVAVRVACIQHDNLVAVHDFFERAGVRLMEMEWLDGFDLREVLHPGMLELSRARLSASHWDDLNRVILTAGPVQPRLKPGVAIQVLRDCLAGLAALHRAGVAHGDVKPANVLLKRTGNAKVIDLGSAVDLAGGAGRRLWTPAYAAPEVLEGGDCTPRSDLASLGYVLVEMLAGQSPFEGLDDIAALLRAKQTLPRRLEELLPPEVGGNELVLHLCRQLVAPDPRERVASAQAAELGRKGAAAFHRQLVKSDLASEYDNDVRVWLEGLG
jgi:serine/threonine-protein kinase